jgi:hypothetical protein
MKSSSALAIWVSRSLTDQKTQSVSRALIDDFFLVSGARSSQAFHPDAQFIEKTTGR